jgi:hypothetical protein
MTEKDRLGYDIQSDVITITACRFHDDDRWLSAWQPGALGWPGMILIQRHPHRDGERPRGAERGGPGRPCRGWLTVWTAETAETKSGSV